MVPVDALIVNPVAGAGRAGRVLHSVLAVLRDVGADPALLRTQRRGDAHALAASLAPSSIVAVLGGDGTLNEVLQGLAGKGSSILLLPAGSGNDLARGLGMPRDPLEAANSLAFVPRDIDLGEIDGHIFANNAGVGLDGEVCRLVRDCSNAFRGPSGYMRGFLACAMNLRAAPLHLELDGIAHDFNGLLLTFANGQFYGRGMRIAPEASLDDGQLDICAVHDLDRLSLLRAFPRVYSGSHVTHPAFRLWRARDISLYGARPWSMHADGEVIGRLSTNASRPTRVALAAHRQRFLLPA